MNFHARPTDINTHGRDVSEIGQDLMEGTNKGRSLEITQPGLVTGAAFNSYRDTWLGQGEKLSVDLDDAGTSTTAASVEHAANEDAIERGYDAIRP